jgi:RNA polymerase sigma-70 factor (ECF subfamily)
MTASFSLEEIYRQESGRVLATLIRLLRDFDLAEEALQDAFAAAVELWPQQGIPTNPRTWLVSTGRFKAIDRLRRLRLHDRKIAELSLEPGPPPELAEDFPDDRLRLIFTCCHPALPPDSRVPLTLRTVCGLTTEEIARGFLVPVTTMAQRLVRAKAKIRDAGIPYQVPPPELLAERMDGVLTVIYLVFTEGYAATSGAAVIRRDLSAEAIRLARLLAELLPSEREARGALALMLLHDARRDARVSPGGELILLEDQNRAMWDRDQIREGVSLVEEVLREGEAGSYAIQAAIAALHCQADSPGSTDWRQIAALDGLLLRRNPSPVVELNHAVAVAMVDGPEKGLRILDAMTARGELRGYHLLPAARADLLRRLGRNDEARAAYREALAQVTLPAERRFLEVRLSQV